MLDEMKASTKNKKKSMPGPLTLPQRADCGTLHVSSVLSVGLIHFQQKLSKKV